MYDRSESDGARVVHEWDEGVSWVAHPDEGGERASHALLGADGLWVVDPLDAPNLDDILDDVGDVTGVAVLSSWHARDADRVADRHDVAVHVPEWMSRVTDRVDAPVERFTLTPGESEFQTISCRPFPLWDEGFLYEEQTATLVIPDSMGTADYCTIDDERLGLQWFRRPQPPHELRGFEPAQILVGHGTPITEQAPLALETALENARRQFPQAVAANASRSARSLIDVVRDTYL